MVDQNSFRPVPSFLNDNLFSSRKTRSSTPCKKKVPPRPSRKSLPSKSRIFPNQRLCRAQAISFKDSDFSTLSTNYDETRTESYFHQCFTIEDKIGSGSFGDVFKCVSKDDGKLYAIKKSRERYKGKSDRERKLQEVAKHEQLPKHPNLVQFYKAWEENGYLYIQTELCECNLTEYLDNDEHQINETLIWDFLADLLSALKHLHDRDLIHLDIKSENIFLSKDRFFKLGDFGLVVSASELDPNEVQEGDPKYLAKETMQGIFTKAADIFSLGITCLELACGIDLPGRDEGWQQLREGRMPPQFFSLNSDLQKVIMGMMHPNYKLRWTADELLQFPPIQKVMRRRRILAKTTTFFYSIVDFFHSTLKFLFQILFISHLISWFKRKFANSDIKRPQTPPLTNQVSPLDWDQSFSDEEAFDDSLLLVPQDDMNGSFLNISRPFNDSSINNINIYHSTINRARKSVYETPMAKMTPLTKGHTLDEGSVNRFNSKLCLNSSFNYSERPSFCDLSDDEEELGLSATSFGPKNLLNIFDKIESEQENGF